MSAFHQARQSKSVFFCSMNTYATPYNNCKCVHCTSFSVEKVGPFPHPESTVCKEFLKRSPLEMLVRSTCKTSHHKKHKKTSSWWTFSFKMHATTISKAKFLTSSPTVTAVPTKHATCTAACVMLPQPVRTLLVRQDSPRNRQEHVIIQVTGRESIHEC